MIRNPKALGCRCAVGRVTGDVRVNGFPWDRASFARVSGYVEQIDVHSSKVGPKIPSLMCSPVHGRALPGSFAPRKLMPGLA